MLIRKFYLDFYLSSNMIVESCLFATIRTALPLKKARSLLLSLKKPQIFVSKLWVFAASIFIQILSRRFFMTYERGKYYFTMNLDIKRWMLFFDVCQILFSKCFVLRQKFSYQKKKKKKIVHVVFDRPLMFYNFFYELIDFIEHF